MRPGNCGVRLLSVVVVLVVSQLPPPRPAVGQAVDLLPDITVDPSEFNNQRHITCVDMPSRAPWRDLRVLRVGIATPNLGTGPLELHAENLLDCNTSNDNVTQIISRSDGTKRSVPVPPGSIYYHPAHRHFHLRGWAQMRIVTNSPSCADPATRASSCVLASGDKLSFCIEDSRVFDSAISGARVFDSCLAGDDGGVAMGISRGWTDVYAQGLSGQFVELGNLPGGAGISYWLEAEANVGGAVQEATHQNDIGRTDFAPAGNECATIGAQWKCAPGVADCTELPCSGVDPACCECTGGGSACGDCKEYFCYLDPASAACLGRQGTCPVGSCPLEVQGPATPCCAGDCNGDNAVTIDELLTMVNIALGNALVAACSAADATNDGDVTVDEIIEALNHVDVTEPVRLLLWAPSTSRSQLSRVTTATLSHLKSW